MAIKFDGRAWTAEQWPRLQALVAAWQTRHGYAPTIHSIFPYEDEASVLYTKLKQTDAARVGIRYELEPLSLQAPREQWLQAIQKANHHPRVQGLLVQKPSAAQYAKNTGKTPDDFYNWWAAISESIALEKDIDGLHPLNLQKLQFASERVARGEQAPHTDLHNWILPATAQAVISIIQVAIPDLLELRQQSVVMIGRSRIVGQPVAYGLRLLGVPVQLLSSQDDLSTQLRSATVVVSATGKSNFIQSDWLQPGEVLIDVGAPTPEFQPACYEQCRFYTPVPFGVGPLTRYCLLENLFK